MNNPIKVTFLVFSTFTFLFLAFAATINAQSTYYSRNATNGGNWKSTSSWTMNSDGSGAAASSVPQRNDDVVILNGHEIKITNTNDNGSSGVKPDNVSDPDNNIGPFNGSGTAMFYHTGNITINAGGTFKVNKPIMIAGETSVSGTLNTNGDLVNIGRMDVYPGGALDVGDDLILSGNSETNIDVASLSADDIYFDNNDSRLCGTGNLTVGDDMQELNSADVDNQVCDGFVIIYDGGTYTGSASFMLPVELYTYEVKLEDNNVRIDWSTASEFNNDYFVVERSQDAHHFEEIGREDGAEYSESFRYYAITDRFPFEGISYYRLKQVDFDGKTTYFDIKMVDNKNGYVDKHGLTVFPNPIMEHSKFSIGLEGFDGDIVKVEIQNMNGFLVYSNEINISQNRELIELNADLVSDSGMYIVSVFSDSKWYHHKFLNIK